MNNKLKSQGFSFSTIIIAYGRTMDRRARKNLAKSVEKQLPFTRVTPEAIILDPLPESTESNWRKTVNAIYQGATDMGISDIKIVGATSLLQWRILKEEKVNWEIA